MRRYADLAIDLQSLLELAVVTSDDETVWIEPSVLEAISSKHLRAALGKARAQYVAAAISERVQLHGHVSAAFTRGQPLVQVFDVMKTDGLKIRAGWQLQGSQFRRAVVYLGSRMSGGSNRRRQLREDTSREHPDLFVIPSALPQVRAGRREFQHYAPDFVYQYVSVPNLTFGQLKHAAAEIDQTLQAMR